MGYDFRVAKHVFISPFFAFVGSAGGDVTQGNGNTVTTDPNFSLLQFGVSLLFVSRSGQGSRTLAPVFCQHLPFLQCSVLHPRAPRACDLCRRRCPRAVGSAGT